MREPVPGHEAVDIGKMQQEKHSVEQGMKLEAFKKESMSHEKLMNGLEMQVIARIHTDFPTKFGVPRQSGLSDAAGLIVFEPEFRQPDALRGIEEYTHLWLLWGFSEVKKEPGTWKATVRPPRLGGNERVGVFACRSPYRPNPIGLSCVKMEKIISHEKYGMCLLVSGVDMMDKTPIYDIKPYLPYVDAHPEASGGFAHEKREYHLEVQIPNEGIEKIPEEKRKILMQILSQDPRPSYQNDPERVYGMEFAGFEVKFRVEEQVLYVVSVEEIKRTVHNPYISMTEDEMIQRLEQSRESSQNGNYRNAETVISDMREK